MDVINVLILAQCTTLYARHDKRRRHSANQKRTIVSSRRLCLLYCPRIEVSETMLSSHKTRSAVGLIGRQVTLKQVAGNPASQQQRKIQRMGDCEDTLKSSLLKAPITICRSRNHNLCQFNRLNDDTDHHWLWNAFKTPLPLLLSTMCLSASI